MRSFLIVFLLVFGKVASGQEIVGKWKPVSYQDDLVYYHKGKDSIVFHKPKFAVDSRQIKDMMELAIFSQQFEFFPDGRLLMSGSLLGNVESSFTIDPKSKLIHTVDGKGNRQDLPFDLANDELTLEMSLDNGAVKLGLVRMR